MRRSPSASWRRSVVQSLTRSVRSEKARMKTSSSGCRRSYMKRSSADCAARNFSPDMLPLTSSTMPRLTGTRSLLKCEICCFSPSSRTTKSSLRRCPAKRPVPSVTVAVTLISSVVLRKRKPSCAASGTTATAVTSTGTSDLRRRDMTRVFMAITDGRTCRRRDARNGDWEPGHSLMAASDADRRGTRGCRQPRGR